MSTNSISISVRDLNLEYKVYQYRSTTLKEFVMNRLKGKGTFQLIKALSDVNFDITKGESVALIGHNGCGKSTLLKCIAGIYQPPGSKITVHGRTAPMIELGAGFDSELSGLENIRLSCMLMGLTADEIEDKIESIVDFSELKNFIDIPFKNYSSGMQARLGFACTTAVDPDVLLIDEVLAVGDSNFSRKCLERIQHLKEKGTTVVLVSHDANAVKTFCSRGIVIDQGKVQFDGAIHEALACQERIMDRRYLDSLSAEERSEILRLRALRDDTLEKGPGSRNDIPNAHVYFQAFQDGAPTQQVDASRPVDFLFRVKADKPHLFDDDVAVGFALHSQGVRVGGYNNLAYGIKIPLDELRSGKVVEVKYHFDGGMECIATGSYKVICGVHDRGITRTVFCGEVSDITVKNPKAGVNMDGDIVAFNQLISSVDLDWRTNV